MQVIITYDCGGRRIPALICLPHAFHSLFLSEEGQFAHRIARPCRLDELTPCTRWSLYAIRVKRGWYRQTPRIILRTCATLSVDSNPRGPGVRDVPYSIHYTPLGEHKIVCQDMLLVGRIFWGDFLFAKVESNKITMVVPASDPAEMEWQSAWFLACKFIAREVSIPPGSHTQREGTK